LRLIILTSNREVDIYEKKYLNKNDIIFPVNAELYETLNKKNIPYINPTEFIDNESYKLNKRKSELIIKNTIEELNNISSNFHKFDDEFKINIGYYYSFNLHIVLGQIHYMSFIIQQLKIKYNPDTWLIFKPFLFINNLYLGFRPNPISIFQEIVFTTNKSNIEVVKYLVTPGFVDYKILLKTFIPDWLFNFYYNKKQQNTYRFTKKSTKKILMIDALYDWHSVFKSDLFKQNFNVDFLYFQYSSPYFKDIKDIYNILQRGVTSDNKVCYDLKKQSKIITKSLYNFINKKEKYVNYLKKIHCILNTVFVKPEHNFLCHIANFYHIPVVTWQHGEMGSYVDIFQESIEVRYTNIYFCYGDGVAPSYKNLKSENSIKEVISVGNLEKKVKSKDSKYILYATGKWTGIVSPFFENYNTDFNLFQTQKKILDFLDNTKVKSLFKISNQPNQNSFPFTLKNVVIDSNTPFKKLLENAYIVILDTPTTTLIESVSTNKPIFVINSLMPAKWENEKFIQLLKKRVLIFNNAEELINSLNNFLKNNIYEADLNDQNFYLEFASKYEDTSVLQIIINKLITLNH
jgi:hypothetical protein